MRRSAPLIEQLRQATVDRGTQRRVNVLNLGVAGYVALDGQRREPFRDGDIRTAGATNSRGTFRVLRRVAMARGRGEESTAVSARGHLTVDAKSQLRLFLYHKVDQIVRHVGMAGCPSHGHVDATS